VIELGLEHPAATTLRGTTGWGIAEVAAAAVVVMESLFDLRTSTFRSGDMLWEF
jgi:hypothetical protein